MGVWLKVLRANVLAPPPSNPGKATELPVLLDSEYMYVTTMNLIVVRVGTNGVHTDQCLAQAGISGKNWPFRTFSSESVL